MNASHPELEALAGLLDEPAGDAGNEGLAAHVAGCPRCQADVRALRGVQQTLRALPSVPMPAEVVARLESVVRVGATEAATVSPLPSGRRHVPAGWRLPHLSAAAGVAVLLIVALGTGIAVMVTHTGTADNRRTAATAASGGEAARTPTVIMASGANYQQATIRSRVAALVIQRVPGSAARFSGLRPLAGEAAASQSAATAPLSTSSASAGSSAAAGYAREATPSPKALTAAVGSARTAPSGPLADTAALAACVRTLTGGLSIKPVLVDYARFDGQLATVIVLPSNESPAKLVVWVEPDGSDCATKGETAYYGTLSTAS